MFNCFIFHWAVRTSMGAGSSSKSLKLLLWKRKTWFSKKLLLKLFLWWQMCSEIMWSKRYIYIINIVFRRRIPPQPTQFCGVLHAANNLSCCFQFFEHGSATQIRELANKLTGHVLALSLQMYGCRVIQKVFLFLVTYQLLSYFLPHLPINSLDFLGLWICHQSAYGCF